MVYDSVLAVMKDWVPLTVSIAALVVSIRSFQLASQKCRYDALSRRQEDEREAYCQDLVRSLRRERTLSRGSNPALFVPDDKLLWARWGEERKMFRLQHWADAWHAVTWYDDPPD